MNAHFDDYEEASFDATSVKRVSFSGHDEVHETLHRLDMVPDERQACWYSYSEQAESRTLAKTIVRKMEKGKKLGNHICTRGLEFRTLNGSRCRLRNQTKAQMAVFEEQLRQRRKDGTENAYSIAFAYEEHTRRCQLHAHMQGMEDQSECERLWCRTGGKQGRRDLLRLANETSKSERSLLRPSRLLGARRLSPRLHRFMIFPGETSSIATAKSRWIA